MGETWPDSEEGVDGLDLGGAAGGIQATNEVVPVEGQPVLGDDSSAMLNALPGVVVAPLTSPRQLIELGLQLT
jgi:hypothetical protein